MKGLLMVLMLLVSVLLLPANAQDLLAGADMYSHKKTAYITKADGTEVEGTITKIKRKKGLLESVAVEVRGKKITLLPEEIDHMYLPPSGLDKFANAMDAVYTLDKWDREDVASDKIKEGYVYFERTKVNLKGTERTLLMQLLNPGFSSRIKVFFDPFAKETARVGVGAFTVSGGLDKSYYIQRGDEVAYRMKKKDYSKDFTNFYSDCQALYAEHGEKPDWSEFAKHVYYYSKECQ